jgi:hypothetical protein
MRVSFSRLGIYLDAASDFQRSIYNMFFLSYAIKMDIIKLSAINRRDFLQLNEASDGGWPV